MSAEIAHRNMGSSATANFSGKPCTGTILLTCADPEIRKD